jgi:hypothetical protein
MENPIKEILNICGKSLFVILVIALILLPIYGWISNFVQFVHLDFKPPYKAEIIRGIGVVTVLPGIILGFVPIQDN